MERLTKRNEHGDADIIVKDDGAGTEIRCLDRAISRLAAYEDTGLEPEEVARERFLIAARKDPEKLARLRDLVFADEQGRVEILPPNEALTLEQLREMDGEPVWVVTGSAINAGRGCWDICDWWDKNTVMFPYSGEQPRVDDYGITWTAYRRKPEEA